MTEITGLAANLASMTGFARAEVGPEGAGWSWELRSVNAKGLDIKFRLGAAGDRLEPELRRRLGARLARGTISVALAAPSAMAPTQGLRLNEGWLAELAAAAARLSTALGPAVASGPPRLVDLMALRGVIEPIDASAPAAEVADDQAILSAFDRALEQMVASRLGEGAALGLILAAHLRAIGALTAEARASALASPALLAERLRDQVARLLDGRVDLPPERLAVEVALLVQKADATEELDRLDAHLQAARDLLAGGGAIGRRLDFLAQEFGREANTLTAKASDLGLTRIGLALKAVVEQFREQVQNLE
jgi:uncharacterized protein (TIGR00255 family)